MVDDGQTYDGRQTTDERRLDGYTISSPCEPNGSGELIKMSSFKSSENIQKKEGGPDRSFSDNQSPSVTLNELATKARKDTVISSFSREVIYD